MAPPGPSSKALRTQEAPGRVLSFENRRRQEGRAWVPGIGGRGEEFHASYDTVDKVTLTGGFPSRHPSVPPRKS